MTHPPCAPAGDDELEVTPRLPPPYASSAPARYLSTPLSNQSATKIQARKEELTRSYGYTSTIVRSTDKEASLATINLLNNKTALAAIEALRAR